MAKIGEPMDIFWGKEQKECLANFSNEPLSVRRMGMVWEEKRRSLDHISHHK